MIHRPAHQGFTLLELLIASIIGSFIALVAVGALRAVTAGRTLVYRNIAAADEIRFAVELLRNDFENMVRDDTAQSRIVGSFVEQNQDMVNSLKMRIISGAPARPQQPESDIYEVEYFLGGSDEQSMLMRRLCPIVGHENTELTRGGILTAIAQNIVAFEVRYFDGAEWQIEWPAEQNLLPQIVEATLTAVEIDQHGRAIPITRSIMAAFPRMPGATRQAEAAQALMQEGL